MTVVDPFAEAQVVVVGAGLSGAVVAERLANVLGKRVLIVDKRDHVGGNCFDYVDDATGIRVSKYGPHFFHTDDEGVWEYINRFCKWKRYDHQSVAAVPGVGVVPLPVNINTLNLVMDKNIRDGNEAREFLDGTTCKLDRPPANGEESCLTRFPAPIYHAIFRPYTTKQWERAPSELRASVLDRIPLRLDFDNRYFSDRYQALPEQGYTAFFQALLGSSGLVQVLLDTDYFQVQHRVRPGTAVIFTGPIDRYFAAQGLPRLEYRSLKFELERHMDQPGFVQTHGVVNYPSADVPFTRITEYKHLYADSRRSPHSLTVKEHLSSDGEEYYPVVNDRNLQLYTRYQQLAEQEERAHQVYFLGRLANYKYYNMDQAIRNALDFFNDKFLHAQC